MINVALQWIIARKFSLLALGVFVVLSSILLSRQLHHHSARTLRMSAGPVHTRRHAVVEYLASQAAQHQLSIQLVDSNGSEDCLQQIKQRKLDAAVVSSGVIIPNDDDISVLAATQLEAIHLLVRKELAIPGNLTQTLRGKRVNIGVPGSTEWLLSREFLKFARLRLPATSEPGEVFPTEFDKDQIFEIVSAILKTTDETARAEQIANLPDCFLILETMPSSIAQLLLELGDYRIMPLPATRAFLLDNLQASDAATTVVEREFLEPTVILANNYFTNRGFPEVDCETVGVRLLVVAHRDTPVAAVRPLMETLFEGEFSRRLSPRSPRDLATPYALHRGAATYLDRDKPLISNDLMESFSTLLSIFGAFSAGALSLYGLLWRKKRRKPIDYYAEVHKLELLATGVPVEGVSLLSSQDLHKYVEERLLKLRHELIADVCDGRLDGDQVIASILGLLADSRNNLSLRTSHEATSPKRMNLPRRVA